MKGRTSDLTYDEKMILNNNILSLDKQTHEYILALIRNYQLDEEEDLCENLLPYSPKQKKNGLKWAQSNIPMKLLLIIKEFVDVHNKSQKEMELTKKHQEQNNNFFA